MANKDLKTDTATLHNVATPWLDSPFNLLIQSHQQGRLAHALLLTGSDGVGKYKLAKKLANYLLCSNETDQLEACGHCHACQLFAVGNHLDFHLLKHGTTKSIGVDQVRSLISVLNERPNLGTNKVVIIKNTQELTIAAANALLKTLEEPQGNSYLILVANNSHQLMPTLISRVQHTHIHTPDDKTLLQWIGEQGFCLSDQGIIKLFQNSPLSLLNHLQGNQDSALIDERRSCVEGVFGILNQPETLFDFSKFLAESADRRLQLLFFLFHDLHKLKLADWVEYNESIYHFAQPQLEIWKNQLNLKSLREMSADILTLRQQINTHRALRKELLISALLIKIKNKFNLSG
ncbi:MAG TPA: DNA polymerase III subunit delta' [Psychromonas hadalis]|nr:DNA polymerase III subunit delta' [Psychromonas hadalis]